jgi:hypothetical protein
VQLLFVDGSGKPSDPTFAIGGVAITCFAVIVRPVAARREAPARVWTTSSTRSC